MSTARTNIGCMAEDYASELAAICAEWWTQQRRYFSAHPGDLTATDQRHMDVAESFVLAARPTPLTAPEREQ